MTLLDLDPHWCKLSTTSSWWCDREDGTLITMESADGILFLCPRCFQLNAARFADTPDLGCPPGHYGTHSVLCWRPRVPQTITPKPGRWEFTGTDFTDLSLVAGSSSVLLTSDMNVECAQCKRTGASADDVCRYCPCRAHFYVRAGHIEFC